MMIVCFVSIINQIFLNGKLLDCFNSIEIDNVLIFRALQAPGWRKEWHCGVRVSKSGRLVGFISAIPVTLNIYEKYESLVNSVV